MFVNKNKYSNLETAFLCLNIKTNECGTIKLRFYYPNT